MIPRQRHSLTLSTATLTVLATLAVSCASTAAVEPLEPLESFPLRLEASVDPVGGEDAWARQWDYGQSGPEDWKGQTLAMSLDCSLVAMPEELVWDVLGGEAGHVAARVSREEAQRILGWLDAETSARIVDEVKLSVFDGQRAGLSIRNEEAYIAGYQLSQEAGVAIADPQVEVMRSGFELRATPSGVGGDTVELQLEFTYRDIDKPLEERRLKIGRHASPVTVQLPVRVTWELSTTAQVQPGDSLILGSLPIAGRRELVVVFANVDVFPVSEVEP